MSSDALATPDDIRRHIGFKLSARELNGEIADRMLYALAQGSELDYAALLEAATFVDAPDLCYHTAPFTSRASILHKGLTPGASTNWPGKNLSSQPVAVYVAPEPDIRGMWSHWNSWDVWEVDMVGLEWTHDRMNPGCYSVPSVPAVRLRLHREEPFSWV